MQNVLPEKWDTLQPPDPRPLTVSFKLLFFCCLRQTNSSLLSPNNRLFSSACCTNESGKKGGRKRGGRGGGLQEQRGREKRICSTELHRSTRLMSCVLGPQGLGVWAPLSYNTVDKKPRALPSGNLRGGVSRPGGKELRREGQNTQVWCSSTGPYTVQRLWPRSMHRRTMEQQYTLTAKGLNVPFFFNRTDYFAEQSCNAI